MRLLLHALLLIGALMGVAAQGVAFAADPCPMEQAQPAAMAGMEDCCPEDSQKQHDKMPCQDMTLACMAMAGCAALAESAASAEVATSADSALLHYPRAVVAFRGRNLIPEPDPPAHLG